MYLLEVTVYRDNVAEKSSWGPFKRLETALAYQARAESIGTTGNTPVAAEVVHLLDHKAESLTDWLYERVPVRTLAGVIPNQ